MKVWLRWFDRDAKLGGDLKYFLFSPLFGEDFQVDYCNIFQMGWLNHQPEKMEPALLG